MRAVLFLLASVALAQQAPRPDLTPGVILPVGTAHVCVVGYSKDARGEHKITAKTRRLVLSRYGLEPKAKGYVIDHLISLELGGSNDINNLQPQTVAEGHLKDRLENYLHREVCAGRMSLAEAQLELALDWPSAYAKYFHGTSK